MKIIVTGSSGLIGSALVASLRARGDEVTRLVREKTGATGADGTREVVWSPSRGELNAPELEGHDAAIHLAGDPIAEGLWRTRKGSSAEPVQARRFWPKPRASVSPPRLVTASRSAIRRPLRRVLTESTRRERMFLSTCAASGSAAEAARLPDSRTFAVGVC